jgi:hypothetical protein
MATCYLGINLVNEVADFEAAPQGLKRHQVYVRQEKDLLGFYHNRNNYDPITYLLLRLG